MIFTPDRPQQWLAQVVAGGNGSVDQRPFARDLLQTAQREPAKADDRLDDAEDRLDRLPDAGTISADPPLPARWPGKQARAALAAALGYRHAEIGVRKSGHENRGPTSRGPSFCPIGDFSTRDFQPSFNPVNSRLDLIDT
jgi:hypothetical protein